MTTEQPLQVSEIYNRLWGYEKPDIKSVLNDIKETPIYKLKKSFVLIQPDGSRYTYTCNSHQLTDHQDLGNFLNDKRETNYLYKYYEKGQEEEVDEYEMPRRNIVRTYYAIPYLKSYFQVGKRYIDEYDVEYTIIRKSKKFLTLKNPYGGVFKVEYVAYYGGEKLVRANKITDKLEVFFAKNWID